MAGGLAFAKTPGQMQWDSLVISGNKGWGIQHPNERACFALTAQLAPNAAVDMNSKQSTDPDPVKNTEALLSHFTSLPVNTEGMEELLYFF